jgi:uncharacterized protein (TIGR02145 family)
MTIWSGANKIQDETEKVTHKPNKNMRRFLSAIIIAIIIVIASRTVVSWKDRVESEKFMSIDSYKTVTIGNQVWMAENLKTTRLNDGTPIPLVKGNTEWEQLSTPAYCWYENDRGTYKETYGALYNWFAVNTGKLCPSGWHVPSDTEWTKLTVFLGDIDYPEKPVAGIKLKEAGNTHWAFNDSINATNEYGFTALPGGYRTIYGVFWGFSSEGSWWSSTEDGYNSAFAKNREMQYDYSNVTDIQQYKQFGMSVRCVKD